MGTYVSFFKLNSTSFPKSLYNVVTYATLHPYSGYTMTCFIPFHNAHLYKITPVEMRNNDGSGSVAVSSFTIETHERGFVMYTTDEDINYICNTLAPNYIWHLKYNALKK